MKLFYAQIEPNDEVLLDLQEQQHMLKVLRMKHGEQIFATDGKGNLAKGTLVIEGKKALMEVESIQRDLPNFSSRIHIAIAPTKNMDRMEFFVEKATEMGVSEITFLQTQKTERKHFNTDKIRKQVISACKQSLRTHFPVVNEMTKFSDFVQSIDSEKSFVAHCHQDLQRQELTGLSEKQDLVFLVGPEGDFSLQEIQMLSDKNIAAVTLGIQRLRTETAGVFLTAWNYSKMMN